jgi:hypothetical protein
MSDGIDKGIDKGFDEGFKKDSGADRQGGGGRGTPLKNEPVTRIESTIFIVKIRVSLKSSR